MVRRTVSCTIKNLPETCLECAIVYNSLNIEFFIYIFFIFRVPLHQKPLSLQCRSVYLSRLFIRIFRGGIKLKRNQVDIFSIRNHFCCRLWKGECLVICKTDIYPVWTPVSHISFLLFTTGFFVKCVFIMTKLCEMKIKNYYYYYLLHNSRIQKKLIKFITITIKRCKHLCIVHILLHFIRNSLCSQNLQFFPWAYNRHLARSDNLK